jgi:hypothetical protein
MKKFKVKISLTPNGRGLLIDETHGIDLSVLEGKVTQEITVTNSDIAAILFANIESGDITVDDDARSKITAVVTQTKEIVTDELEQITPKPKKLPEKFTLTLAEKEVMWGHDSCPFVLNRMEGKVRSEELYRSKLTNQAVNAIVAGLNSGRMYLNVESDLAESGISVDLNEDAVEIKQHHKYLLGILDTPLSQLKTIVSDASKSLDLRLILSIERSTRKREDYIKVLREAIGVD